MQWLRISSSRSSFLEGEMVGLDLPIFNGVKAGDDPRRNELLSYLRILHRAKGMSHAWSR